jgi:hypothetical protein
MSARAARAALGLLALSLLWGCAARWRDTSLPWTATGAERLAVFAAAYVALAGLAWRIAPRRWTAILTVCGLAYAAWWVGVGALAAVLLFALAAYLAGRRLTGREDLLAWIVGVGCYSWLAGVLAFLPVNGPWLHAALHLVPVLADWRAAGRLMRRLAAPAHAGPGWLHPAFGFVLLAHLLVVLKPEAGPDALSMHLVVPATVDWRGFWPFDVREFLWAVMPMGANWAFTTVYLIGGEAACRLLNYGFFLALLAQTSATAARLASPRHAALATLLLATTPLTQLVTGSLYVENYWALMLLGMIEAGWRAREGGDWRIFAWLAGCALAAKTGSLPLVLAALAMFAPPRRAWVSVAACCTVTGSGPYLNAWWRTGNPVFPFANTLFRSPLFDPRPLVDARFTEGLTWDTLYRLTFSTSRYFEGSDGAFGFHWLVLVVPAAVGSAAAKWRRSGPGRDVSARGLGVPLAAIAVCVGVIFAWQANVRYLYPVLPLASALVACSLALLPARAASWCAGGLAALNFAFLPASGWLHRDFALHPGARAEEWRAYRDRMAPTRALIDWLNQNRAGEPAAFLAGNSVAGLRAPAYSNSWHSPALERRLREAGSAEEIAAGLRQLGVRRAVTPESALLLNTPALRQFAARYLRAEFQHAGWEVAAVRNQPLPLPAVTLEPGSYDDAHPAFHYRGPWLHDTHAPGASGGTLTYSGHPGARLTFRFQGRRLVYVFTRAPNRGIASVWLDGRNLGEIDLYSPEVRWRQKAEFTFPEGLHEAEIRIEKRTHRLAAGFHVDVDRWEIE